MKPCQMWTMGLVVVCLSLAAMVVTADKVAPSTFEVLLETTKGAARLEVHREWAPLGADRFYTLLLDKFYNDVAFFRVIRDDQTNEQFVAQWGISGSPNVSTYWATRDLPNEVPGTFTPVSNLRGTIAYAAAYVNGSTCCRTTQVFVNYGNNSFLDAMDFYPFALVADNDGSMAVLDSLYAKYGEAVSQPKLSSLGNDYLAANFPLLDYIVNATILPSSSAP